MGTATEVSVLRQKLLVLDYDEPFTVDSMRLVSRLFQDMVATTEAFEHLQAREELTARELALSQSQLFPLKKENARLIRENAALHQKAIQMGEEAAAAARAALLERHRLSDEVDELKKLVATKAQLAAETDTRCEEMHKALKRTLDGRNGAVTAAKEMMAERESARIAVQKQADGMLKDLQHQLRATVARADSAESENAGLRNGVEARDKELKRILKQLEAMEGRGGGGELGVSHALEANEKMLERMNTQVDFLNGQLAVRETQLMQAQEGLRAADNARRALESARDISRKLQLENASLMEKLKKREEDVESMRREVDEARQQLPTVDELIRTRQSAAKWEEQARNASQSAQAAEDLIVQLRKDIAVAEENRRSLETNQDRTRDLDVEHRKLLDELRSRGSTIEELESQKKDLESQLETAWREVQAREEEIAHAKSEAEARAASEKQRAEQRKWRNDASTIDTLDSEHRRLMDALNIQEDTIEALTAQKRVLEDQLAAARGNAESRGLEAAVHAKGEVEIHAILEERGVELQRWRDEAANLANRLLDEEKRSAASRDEAARATASVHSLTAKIDFLTNEKERLHAVTSILRSQLLEVETTLSRTRAELDRKCAAMEGVEQQLASAREELSSRTADVEGARAIASAREAAHALERERLEKAHAMIREAQAEAINAKSMADALRRDLEASTEEISDLRSSLRISDADREALQAKLDAREEERVAQTAARAADGERLAQFEQELRRETTRTHDLAKALEQLESQKATLEAQLSDLSEWHKRQKSAHETTKEELRAAAEDLDLMARENNALSADAAQSANEKALMENKLTEMTREAAEAQQQTRAAQFERDDVLACYRSLFEERRRLEAGTDELNDNRQRLQQALAERETEVAALRTRVRAAEAEIQRRSIDHAALQRQVEDLSSQLQRAGRQVEGESSRTRQLATELESQRTHTASMIERMRMQQAHTVAAAEEVGGLQGRLAVLEQERDTLRRILQEERANGAGLQQLIEASRLKEASLAHEHVQLGRERGRLEAHVSRLEAELRATREALQEASTTSINMSDITGHNQSQYVYDTSHHRISGNKHHITSSAIPGSGGNSPIVNTRGLGEGSRYSAFGFGVGDGSRRRRGHDSSALEWNGGLDEGQSISIAGEEESAGVIGEDVLHSLDRRKKQSKNLALEGGRGVSPSGDVNHGQPNTSLSEALDFDDDSSMDSSQIMSNRILQHQQHKQQKGGGSRLR